MHRNSSDIEMVFISIISTEFHLGKLLISLRSGEFKTLAVDIPNLWGKGRASSASLDGKLFPKARVLFPMAGQQALQRTSQEAFKA